MRRAGREGFTLIEALVAFAIVAALSLVVQRGLVQSRVGWAAVEDRTGAERLARSLLEEPLTPVAVAAGGREGVTDGRRWRIGLQSLDLPLPSRPLRRTAPAERRRRRRTAPAGCPCACGSRSRPRAVGRSRSRRCGSPRSRLRHPDASAPGGNFGRCVGRSGQPDSRAWAMPISCWVCESR